MQCFLNYVGLVVLGFVWHVGAQKPTPTSLAAVTPIPTKDGAAIAKTASTNGKENPSEKLIVGGEISIVYDAKKMISQLEKGCNQIRLRRYVGNSRRNCTTLKPVKFSLCGGFCLPKFRISQLATNFERILQKTQYRYRCTPDNYHFKKVRIFCADDGSISEYKVKVIKSCRCKKFTNQQNMILTPSDRKKSSPDEKHTAAESDDDGDEEPVTEEQ